MSFNIFKDILLIMWYLELFQKFQVFVTKGFLPMMLRLISNVCDHRVQLRMRIRKCAETLLPPKAALHPSILVNMIG